MEQAASWAWISKDKPHALFSPFYQGKNPLGQMDFLKYFFFTFYDQRTLWKKKNSCKIPPSLRPRFHLASSHLKPVFDGLSCRFFRKKPCRTPVFAGGGGWAGRRVPAEGGICCRELGVASQKQLKTHVGCDDDQTRHYKLQGGDLLCRG